MLNFLSYDLVRAFANGRNNKVDFSFLKENGELLCIARSQGFLMEPRAQEFYQGFYSQAQSLLELYPQYYRFILGLVLDLEDLGLSGNVGRQICEQVRSDNLLAYDTSDIRRLEAIHLLGRRLDITAQEMEVRSGLIQRLEMFTSNAQRFYKFNRPLFYDLTHLVFFLTDYGKTQETGLSNLEDCLLSVGVLALLDNDIDLLSEVIIGLNYIGAVVPEYWKADILNKQANIQISFDQKLISDLSHSQDDYHVYLVLNWCLNAIGVPSFQDRFSGKTPSFKHEEAGESLLSKFSTLAHDRLMRGRRGALSSQEFLGTLNIAENNRLTLILESTPHGADCLTEFSSGVIQLAA